MRLIGHIENERDARVLGNYLTAVEVKNLVEPDTDGSWAIWVQSEEQLSKGLEILNAFKANPNEPKYQEAARVAKGIEEKEKREQERYEARQQSARTLWPTYVMGWGTVMLMAISIGVAVLAGMPPIHAFGHWLWISEYTIGLRELHRGELWRVVTPIFMHMGYSHIIFNMLSLRFLGSMVESRLGTWKFLLLVLVIAVPSNFGQAIIFGPEFGGMSGVLYGLFGFVLIRSRVSPNCGMVIDQTNTIMMIGFFFLCLFGVIPNVANGVHAIGFGIGMALGAWPVVTKLFQGK